MKVLKWVGIIVVAILLIIGGFLAFIAVSGLPEYDTRKIDLKVESTPERIAQGRKLASRLCMECHMNPETKRLTGIKLLDLPEEFGTAYSKNITNHPERGIGKWTDGDIAWLLRTGVHPHTGMYVPPWMPKFPHMADEDVMSIISWLRSDDPALAADPAVNRDSDPTFFAKFLSRVAFKAFDYPESPKPYPDTTNSVAYGKYLATAVYDCYQCHSADFASNDPLNPPASAGFFGGGLQMTDATGSSLNIPNITSHKEMGIGRWTRSQFIQTMYSGVTPEGKAFRYPMARFNTLSDHALGSMYDYLMTVPALDNKVERTVRSGTYDTKGAELFDKHGCTSCHGYNGVGFASLKLASRKYPEDSTLIDVIKDEIRYNPDSIMPHFGQILGQEDLEVLAVHVRKLCMTGDE